MQLRGSRDARLLLRAIEKSSHSWNPSPSNRAPAKGQQVEHPRVELEPGSSSSTRSVTWSMVGHRRTVLERRVRLVSVILANGLIRTLDPQVPTQRALAIAGEPSPAGSACTRPRSPHRRSSTSAAASSCRGSPTRTCTSRRGRSHRTRSTSTAAPTSTRRCRGCAPSRFSRAAGCAATAGAAATGSRNAIRRGRTSTRSPARHLRA